MAEIPWLWIWIVLAALLYIGEMLTTAFFLLPFALGATAALLGNLLGAALWLQWVLFIVVSILCLIFVRPFFKQLTSKAEKVKAGVDRLIDMTGVIVEGNAPTGANRARIDRELWNVSTETGEQLAIDTKIRVLRVEGTYLIVEAV
ncbi:MAG: NfeD family protein [Eggerthellaceae bacterium]|jgi:membrane protein implicated in regulation of membrane protease activity|nr:NfeD family protein [Eggerthellaceae bacterium]